MCIGIRRGDRHNMQNIHKSTQRRGRQEGGGIPCGVPFGVVDMDKVSLRTFGLKINAFQDTTSTGLHFSLRCRLQRP